MKFLLKTIILLCFLPYWLVSQEAGATKNVNDSIQVEVSSGKVVEDLVDLRGDASVSPLAPYMIQYIDEQYADSLNDSISITYKYEKGTGRKFYGVQKNGKEVLPVAFSTNHKLWPKNLTRIFGIGDVFGLFDIPSEKWLIPLEFSVINYLDSIHYIVRKGKFYGIYDISTQQLGPMSWTSMDYAFDGYVLVVKDEKYGVLRVSDNQLTTPCIYSKIWAIKGSRRLKVEQNRKFNIIDVNNKVYLKKWYQELHVNDDKILNYIVKSNDRMGIVDENGKTVLPLNYLSIASRPFRDGSYLVINKDGKYGCVKLTGSITLDFEYDFLQCKNCDTYDTFLTAHKKGKYGIINLDELNRVNGKIPSEAILCEYDTLVFSKPLSLVSKDGKYGFIDVFGKVICPLVFDYIDYSEYRSGEKKIFIATQNSLELLINDRGEPVTEGRYERINQLKEIKELRFSKYLVYYNDGKAGLLDNTGKEITSNIFDDIFYFSNPDIIVKVGDKMGVYHIFTNRMIVDAKYDNIFFSSNRIYGKIGNTIYNLILGYNGTVIEQKL